MHFYISGPMAGKEASNLPAFRAAAARLASLGHTYQIPHDITPWQHGGECPPGYASNEGHTSACLLRGDLFWLITQAEALYMLRGWENSIGARLEHEVASRCGFPIFYQNRDTVPQMSLEVHGA